MQSKTSFFNKGIYWYNLKRFWLIGFAFAFFLALVVLSYLSNLSMRLTGSNDVIGSSVSVAQEFLWQQGITMTYFLGFFCLAAGLAVFSYMHFQRNAGMMHALPVSRDSLFVTHYLSGLTLVFAPLLINGIILIVGQVLIGVTHLEYAFLWLILSLTCSFLLYSFTVFAGMFTGHMAAQAIFYLIFNLLAVFIENVVNSVLSNFLYGFHYPGQWVSRPLSPLVYIEEFFTSFGSNVGSISILTGYVIAAILFTGGAFLIYRKRRMEVAGDVISLKVMKPIFKYSVAFCASALLGSIIVGILNIGNGFVAYIISYLAGGFIGYFAAEMLLKKAFRVFKSIKGFLIFALVVVLLLSSIQFDFFGYETYVPDGDEVEIMFVGGYYDNAAILAINPERYNPRRDQYIFYDSRLNRNPPQVLDEAMIQELRKNAGVIEGQEAMDKALKLHHYITTHRSEIENMYRPNTLESINPNTVIHTGLSFIYRIKSGKIVQRSYYLPYFKDNRTELDALLKDLYSTNEVRLDYNPILSVTPQDISVVTIAKPSKAGDYIRMNLTDDTAEFLKAYQQDVLELDPINALTYMREANPTSIEVTFGFQDTYRNLTPQYGGMIQLGDMVQSFNLMSDNKHALEFLKDNGYLTDEDIVMMEIKY